MKTSRHIIAACAAFALTHIHSSSAQTIRYSLTQIGSSGSAVTVPRALNNQGQVVGYTQSPVGERRGFLWQNGKLTDLGLDQLAFGINDQGIIVGVIGTRAGTCSGGTWNSIPGIPTEYPSFAFAVSPNGTIIGSFGTIDQWQHGSFVVTNGSVWIGYANGSENCFFHALNSSGLIAGEADTHAMSWQFDGSTLVSTNDLGSGVCESVNCNGCIIGNAANSAASWSASSLSASGFGVDAESINSSGMIVGSPSFIYDPTTRITTDLNTVIDTNITTINNAVAINDRGQIVARSVDGKAWLLSPYNLEANPTPLAIQMVPAIVVSGSIGATYHIEYTDTLNNASWTYLSTMTLTNAQQIYMDATASGMPSRYYRQVLVP